MNVSMIIMISKFLSIFVVILLLVGFVIALKFLLKKLKGRT